MTDHTAVVVGGNRIPFARAHGAYSRASNVDMLTAALDGLAARFGLAGRRVGEVVGGAVFKHSRDFNLTREAVLGSSLDPHTPACDLQQACATGLEATIYVSNKIRLGQMVDGIAGGADSVSDSPMAISDGLRRALLAANAAKTVPARLAALASIRPGHLVPDPPGITEPRTGLSMGEHQALTTMRWGITRGEQDELALASHQNLARAWSEGFFDDLVTPYLGVTKDQGVRGDTTIEKLAALKAVFGRGEGATMTAGNSTGFFDGAAVTYLADADYAAEHHLPALARVVDAEVAAVDYTIGGEDLLLAPTYAIPRLLARNGLTWQDFDYYEIHEAFAATVLATLDALADETYCRERLGLPEALGEIDRGALNVNGSSLAAGHPFAATGGRIVSTLAKLLHQRGTVDGRPARGIVSICAAGGQGAVAILEAC
ncbi:MAG: acetyl-CoA C-acetyltransferase [Propionibacteriaceae bacterium]